jgi:HEAT repeat protein
MVAERAKSEDVPEIRAAAVRLLAQSRGNDSQTWVIVELAGREGQHILVRQAAFTVITEAKPRDPQLFEIIIEATQGKEPLSRELAVYVLSESAGNELDIHELLGRIAKGDTKPNVRLRALRGFCKPLNQAAGRELADYVARNDPDSEVRRAALSILACDLEFTSRILLLEDPGSAGWRFDGPCIDPAVPFNDVRIARIARLTPYSTAQVRDKLGMLSQRLNGLIKIAT